MLDNNQEQHQRSNDMLSIMGLWENTDKRGNKYLSGNLGSIRVLIFKNTYKQSDRDPDYRLNIAKRQPQESGGYQSAQHNAQASAGEGSQAAPQANTPPPAAPEKEDDIPF